MMQNQAPAKPSRWSTATLAVAVSLLAACGNKSPEGETAVASARKKPASASEGVSTAVANLSLGTPVIARSIFTVTNTYRDPFFPKSKRAAEPATGAVSTNVPVNVVAQLEEGFAGVMLVGNERLALIHDTILEPGKSAVITFRINGRDQKVTVRCQRVLPNGVVLEVPGQPQPVTITGKISR